LSVLTRGAGHGIAFVGSIVGVGSAHAAHFAGSTFMATLRVFGDGVMVPVKAVGKVAGLGFRSHAVNAIIRPADANALPVITSPSPAQLAKLTAAQRQQLAGLQAQQIADNRALGGQVLTANQYHGGYPAKWDNAPEDSTVDNWGMYNRECVSYVAWKVYQTYGAMPYWGGVGNANEWLHDAAVSGIPTGATPKVHSVAVSMRGYYGHTMWVEQVKGNMILVSQYNYDLTGHYSEMWVRGDYFTYIYFH
jgi:surface antigen